MQFCVWRPQLRPKFTQAVPSVAVVVNPYSYATAFERLLRDRGYDVDALDAMPEEWEPARRYDFVLTTFSIPHTCDSFHIDLPDDYAQPVKMSAGGVTVELLMDAENPVEDLLGLIARLAAESVDTAADALLAVASQGRKPSR